MILFIRLFTLAALILLKSVNSKLLLIGVRISKYGTNSSKWPGNCTSVFDKITEYGTNQLLSI